MLTDAEIRNAVCPPDRPRLRLSDGGGLYLEVSPNGAKRWFWKFRLGEKETRMALGTYPAVKGPAARKARDSARDQRATGVDPVVARKLARLKATNSNTFAAVAQEWLDLNLPNWSAGHGIRERRNVTKDLIPHLGSRDIDTIEPIEILAVIHKVEERGALDVAHRVLQTAHGIWCHAVATGRARRDVTPDIRRALKPHTKRNMPAIIDPVELGELLRASKAYRGGAVVRAALQIAPILFQRPGNLRMMRWADLDLDKAIWTIPSADMKRSKAQKLNGQPHKVPLPRQVVQLLRELHVLTGEGVYVFPGLRNPKAPLSEAGVTAALHAMGYKDRHTWHGYRATGRTLLKQVLKYDKDTIEAQLAHKGQITHGGAYDRDDHLEDRAEMLQVWADYLDNLASGANVIPLPRKRVPR